MSSQGFKRNWPPPAFHVMLKPCGSICNLNCDYCYFLSKKKLYPGSSFRMTDETLEVFTSQYIQAQSVPEVTFAWQGGEPTLMGLEFYKKALEFQNEHSKSGLRILNTMQTNGTLLDDAWCEFFKENNFLIGISLDGPAELHNAYRRDVSRNPSFSKVMTGIELLKKHAVDFNILSTVHAANQDHPLEVYYFLRDEIETAFIQFIPIVELNNKSGYQKGNKLTNRSVDSRAFGQFLITVYDEWIKHDVGSVFIQHFDSALGNWLGSMGGLCVFNPVCGSGLALEHNGDLYACDHYVEPKFKLGNINKRELIDLVAVHKQYQFGMNKLQLLPKTCLSCEVRFACHGGCLKNRIRQTEDAEHGLNYLCEGYKLFFNHINESMKNMVDLIRQNRAPTEIMQVFKSQ
ncbi:MAG: anaerobic sulfatase maturase [Anaerolineaceae bacterium]|nr:anaerobic sulfatase maturase [Anaerolineaceae bacterium]